MAHSVQIIGNTYLRPKRDGRYFPTLAQEVLDQDMVCSSSWYDLSEEAYREWLLCRMMWKAERDEDMNTVKKIQDTQRDKHERLEWVLEGERR